MWPNRDWGSRICLGPVQVHYLRRVASPGRMAAAQPFQAWETLHRMARIAFVQTKRVWPAYKEPKNNEALRLAFEWQRAI